MKFDLSIMEKASINMVTLVAFTTIHFVVPELSLNIRSCFSLCPFSYLKTGDVWRPEHCAIVWLSWRGACINFGTISTIVHSTFARRWYVNLFRRSAAHWRFILVHKLKLLASNSSISFIHVIQPIVTTSDERKHILKTFCIVKVQCLRCSGISV